MLVDNYEGKMTNLELLVYVCGFVLFDFLTGFMLCAVKNMEEVYHNLKLIDIGWVGYGFWICVQSALVYIAYTTINRRSRFNDILPKKHNST